MKIQQLLVAGAIGIVLSSCGKKEEKCNYNGKEVPCGYFRVYNQFKANEDAINATFKQKFGPEPPYMSLEDKYELRKNWVSYYDTKKDSIIEAYKVMGDNSKLEDLVEMRKGEVEHFKEAIEDKRKAAVMAKEMNMKHEAKDDSLSGSKKILVTMTNTSSDTVVAVDVTSIFMNAEGQIIQGKSGLFMTGKVAPGEDFDVSVSYPQPSKGKVDSYDIEIDRIQFKKK